MFGQVDCVLFLLDPSNCLVQVYAIHFKVNWECHGCPSDPFTIIETQNMSYNFSDFHKTRLSSDFKALKLRKCRSGVPPFDLGVQKKPERHFWKHVCKKNI